ncbi:hypothetical protein WMY93_031290 [Mugilogobius chulae]|uniref:Uncharacterized protein n=1 Tax=Mugilogobius chulae TaxID=88201 RepID=A0AAW0MG95_9GOBI
MRDFNPSAGRTETLRFWGLEFSVFSLVDDLPNVAQDTLPVPLHSTADRRATDHMGSKADSKHFWTLAKSQHAPQTLLDSSEVTTRSSNTSGL